MRPDLSQAIRAYRGPRSRSTTCASSSSWPHVTPEALVRTCRDAGPAQGATHLLEHGGHPQLTGGGAEVAQLRPHRALPCDRPSLGHALTVQRGEPLLGPGDGEQGVEVARDQDAGQLARVDAAGRQPLTQDDVVVTGQHHVDPLWFCAMVPPRRRRCGRFGRNRAEPSPGRPRPPPCPGWGRAAAWWLRWRVRSVGGCGSGLLGELDVDDELDLLGDQDAALFEVGVPGQAPVGAVELAGGLEGGLVVAPGVGGDAVELDVEGDRLGDALDGQVAGEGVAVVGGADEGDLGEGVDVEEVGAAQVGVAVGGAGADRGGLDDYGGDGLGDVIADLARCRSRR